MARIDIFFLDNLNNTKEEINMIKPKSYQELLEQLGNRIVNLPKFYEIYFLGKNNEKIIINNEEKYKVVEDFLFIREIDEKILDESLYALNYKRLSESQQDKLDEKFNCMLCAMVIKNENPYLCYQCQKIFHIKCLDNWDKKCKQENKKFSCPNCRNDLPKENWNKKLDYEGNRKDNANLMNKINEYKLNNNMNNNINIIKEKKIYKLKHKEISQQELIRKYEAYITKTINLFKIILNKINLIHKIISTQSNKELKNLIDFYPLNLENLYIDSISNVINEELELFKNNLKNLIINKIKEERDKKKEDKKFQNIFENAKIILGKNLSQIINNYNKDQIAVLKIALDFYKENNLPQMNYNNDIQFSNLINNLFSSNIEFINELNRFKYITHDKRRKRIKFIFNSSRYLIDIPIFFTNKELYSIAQKYKQFHSTKIILIHKNKILNNDELSLDAISNGDIIWVVENNLYPDKSYYLNLQKKYYGTKYINIKAIFGESYELFSFSIEATIQELTRAIAESKGYAFEDCILLYNAKQLYLNDKRKIKEVIHYDFVTIQCLIDLFGLHGFTPFGKKILAKGNNYSVFIGTLDPIENLFLLITKKRGKIIIGNVELTRESENYLSFYGINENFNFIYKEE